MRVEVRANEDICKSHFAEQMEFHRLVWESVSEGVKLRAIEESHGWMHAGDLYDSIEKVGNCRGEPSYFGLGEFRNQEVSPYRSLGSPDEGELYSLQVGRVTQAAMFLPETKNRLARVKVAFLKYTSKGRDDLFHANIIATKSIIQSAKRLEEWQELSTLNVLRGRKGKSKDGISDELILSASSYKEKVAA